MNKQRESFEAWAYNNGFNLARDDFDDYENTETFMAYEAWQASSIPEGYVVVPKEPTQEMIEAHMNSKVILAYVGAYEKAVESYKKQYKAMIEAVEKNDE